MRVKFQTPLLSRMVYLVNLLIYFTSSVMEYDWMPLPRLKRLLKRALSHLMNSSSDF